MYIKANHGLIVAIDAVEEFLAVGLLAGDAGGIVGQSGKAAVGLQAFGEGALRHRALGVADEVAVDLGIDQGAVEMAGVGREELVGPLGERLADGGLLLAVVVLGRLDVVGR